jgi:hypothetical protein
LGMHWLGQRNHRGGNVSPPLQPPPEYLPRPTYVPPTYGVSPPVEFDDGPAVELRTQAFAACDHSRWAECLHDLDLAKRLDPRGDGTPNVQAYRERAELHHARAPH